MSEVSTFLESIVPDHQTAVAPEVAALSDARGPILLPYARDGR